MPEDEAWVEECEKEGQQEGESAVEGNGGGVESRSGRGKSRAYLHDVVDGCREEECDGEVQD